MHDASIWSLALYNALLITSVYSNLVFPSTLGLISDWWPGLSIESFRQHSQNQYFQGEAGPSSTVQMFHLSHTHRNTCDGYFYLFLLTLVILCVISHNPWSTQGLLLFCVQKLLLAGLGDHTGCWKLKSRWATWR